MLALPEPIGALIAALGKPPKVVDLPQAGHNTISGNPEFEQALADFLR